MTNDLMMEMRLLILLGRVPFTSGAPPWSQSRVDPDLLEFKMMQGREYPLVPPQSAGVNTNIGAFGS